MNGVTKAETTTAVSLADNTGPDLLIERQRDNNVPDTPSVDDIFLAAQYGDWQRIEHLIQAGLAHASDRNEQGITPLHWAAINDRLLACKTLVDHGADVNAHGGDLNATPMMWAAKNGHVYIVHLLITYGGDPALVDSQGYNVLQLATHSSNIMLILFLLHIDLPVDSIDPQGHTCLMWAAYQGDVLSVNAFLKWGAKINAKDHDGLNALHWSIVRGNRQCIKRIIEEGGDLSAKQNEGKDPRALATELKTINAFESALESIGRDSETGLCKKHWLSQELSMKAIFVLPSIYLGIIIHLFSVAPVMISLPINLLIMYGGQKACSSLLSPPSIRKQGIHKTPYLAGIFFGSGVWTVLHWASMILPKLLYEFPFLNLLFAAVFTVCIYHFLTALASDPGFIPTTGGRTEQREAIEELLRDGQYDSQHFCIDCLLRKPMRSKHCKICQRCVARHDHHCPWVNNCVGIRNHVNFMVYILALFIGIPLYAYLVSLNVQRIGSPKNPTECTILAEEYCAWIQIDGFGILLAAWDCLQMTWVSMLVIVQSWQITKARTTQEVVNVRRHGFMGGALEKRRVPVAAQVATLIASGTTDPGAAALSAGGQGPTATCEEGHEHCASRNRKHGQSSDRGGCMSTVTRLLGIDQFVDTAKEGLAGRKGRRSRKFDNPFDGGAVSNCADFWKTKDKDTYGEGAGLVKRQPVDFYKLYAVPENHTEMYARIPVVEEV